MIKTNYQQNRNNNFVDEAQQCFAFLHIKPKFKFALQWSWILETELIWATFNIHLKTGDLKNWQKYIKDF